MPKFTIVLLDRDREFIDRITGYVRDSVYAAKLNVVGLTETEAVVAYFSASPRIDLLVGTAAMLDKHGLSSVHPQTVVLVEEDEPAVHGLFKYRPASLLAGEWVRLCESQLPRYVRGDGRTCPVIAVYAAAGGSGKSTVALNFAHMIGKQGRSVCLLNLEAIESFPASSASPGGVTLSRLLYEVQTKPDRPLEPSLLRHSYGAPQRWFAPARLAGRREMEEMSEEHTSLLIRKIALEGGFDALVVDLESSLHPRIRAALLSSEAILWLVSDDEICARKTSALLGEMERHDSEMYAAVRRSALFVRNKHTGSAQIDFSELDIPITAELPYVPAWKQVPQVEKLLEEPTFQAALQHLLVQTLGIPEEWGE